MQKATNKGNNIKKVQGQARTRTAQAVLPKDAGSFLKQRMSKKLKELRAGSALVGSAADGQGDDDAMADASAPAAAEGPGLDALVAEAGRRCDEFAEELAAEGEEDEFDADWGRGGNGEAENNRKRFYNELRKVLANADVIVEVLDARDPEGCRCEKLEREVLAKGSRLVLLLNKIDLVPKEAVQAWIKHLQRSFPAIAFKSAHGATKRVTHAQTSVENAPIGLLNSTHAVVGADELMQLLKNYSRMSGGGKMKGHVTVGFVGYPNTGKSSVINSMKRQHGAVATGGTAGVTKVMQEVHLDSKVTLIDSPGVVFEGNSDDPSVVLRNVVRVENLTDPVGVVEALLKKAPEEAVRTFYNLPGNIGTVMDFLTHVAQMRGKLRRGSGLCIPSAAQSVITDWTTGKFRYYVMPPAASTSEALEGVEREEAQVVDQLAPRFDIDALLAGGGSDELAQPLVLGAPAEEEGDEDAMDDGASGAVLYDMSRPSKPK